LKRSVVLDLRSEVGARAWRGLIKKADVFIHSMRFKAIAKLGFSYQDVAAINPAIVYTNCYGYGRRGPERDLTAYDDTVQAECGLPAVQKMVTGEASYVGTIIADKVAGLTALYATMMALFHRERSGEGQEVEVSMFETMASFYNKQWSAFVEAVRRPWAGEAFATLEQRVRHIDTVYALLAGTLKERTTEEWLGLFRALELPAPPRSSAQIRERCSRNSDCLRRVLPVVVGLRKFDAAPFFEHRAGLG
jgi:crotonobetainyl-CoA:carnitine CoA-transferase CaiB-like acyl-CoA transferase